jgi:hypothetical protein
LAYRHPLARSCPTGTATLWLNCITSSAISPFSISSNLWSARDIGATHHPAVGTWTVTDPSSPIGP